MRRLALSLATSLVLAIGAAAAAPAATAAPEAAPAAQTERELPPQPAGRSGFWTSRRPAQGGAYRWRMLGIGVALAAVTGALMLRAVRRANRDRARRAGAGER